MKLLSRGKAIMWLLLIVLSNLTPIVLSAANGGGRLGPAHKRPLDQSTQTDDEASREFTHDTDGGVELSFAHAGGSDAAEEKSALVPRSNTNDLEVLGGNVLGVYSDWDKISPIFLFRYIYRVIYMFQENYSLDKYVKRLDQFKVHGQVCAKKLGGHMVNGLLLQKYGRRFREESGFLDKLKTRADDLVQLVKQYTGDLVQLAKDSLALFHTYRRNVEQMIAEYFEVDRHRMTAFIGYLMECADKEDAENGNVNVDNKSKADPAVEDMEHNY